MTAIGNGYGIRDWDDLRLLLALHLAGNFQGAARLLKTDQSTVSRRYHRFELALGAKIFERHGKELKLTEPGRLIVERAKSVEDLVKELNLNLGALDVLPSGTVKISCTEGLASVWLTPLMGNFCAQHPDIDIDIITSHGEYEIISKDADIGIGYTRPTNVRLVSRLVGRIPTAVFASASYLEAREPVEDSAQIRGHDIIDYHTHHFVLASARWLDAVRENNHVRLRTTSAAVYVAAVRAGLGIGVFPRFYRDICPDLVELPSSTVFDNEVWLVSHEETNQARRIRLVVDCIARGFDRDRQKWFTNRAA